MAQKATTAAILLLATSLTQAGCALAPGSLGPDGSQARSITPAEKTTRAEPGVARIIKEEPTKEEADVIRAVDAEICKSYKGWRKQGNPSREHMEEWCPTKP